MEDNGRQWKTMEDNGGQWGTMEARRQVATITIHTKQKLFNEVQCDIPS